MARSVRVAQAPATQAPLAQAPVAPPASSARLVGRVVHPMAWWAWALSAAIAVSLVHNPLLVVLMTVAVWLVVGGRRTRAPWARAAGAYLVVALVIVAIRMTSQVLIGLNRSGTVLFTLPQLQLPAWMAGIRLGGPVTLDALLYTLYDSLQLVGMLLCVGAANALANPKRALRAVPPALYQFSVALVIALSVAPQLIESVQRVRRARRLRGGASTGWRAVRAVVVPVLEDSIERSLQLAAGMESRGYGRTNQQARVGWGTTSLLVGAMLLLVNGLFLTLTTLHRWPWLMVLAGIGCAWLGLRTSGRRLQVTRYRPDVWERPEWSVVAAGLSALVCVVWLGSALPVEMTPVTSPPEWPQLHPLMLLPVIALASPLLTTPAPARDDL